MTASTDDLMSRVGSPTLHTVWIQMTFSELSFAAAKHALASCLRRFIMRIGPQAEVPSLGLPIAIEGQRAPTRRLLFMVSNAAALR